LLEKDGRPRTACRNNVDDNQFHDLTGLALEQTLHSTANRSWTAFRSMMQPTLGYKTASLAGGKVLGDEFPLS